MTPAADITDRLATLRRAALATAVVGALLGSLGAWLDAEQFFRSYLLACLYWWTISTGCLALVLLHDLVGGAWGVAGRPFFEAGARTAPLVALLFLPLLLGLEHVYEWARPLSEQAEPLEGNKAQWLDKPFLLGRAAAYFLIWTGYALWWTRRTVAAPATEIQSRGGTSSAWGLVVLMLTVSLAAFDWIMSLTPHWYSTIYGAHFAIASLMAGMALSIACATRLLPRFTSPQVLNDLGNLQLAFLMVWAYFSFSQFLIIWSGNLPEEASWYVARITGGWLRVAQAIIVLHFAVPFFCLLSRPLKQSPRQLGAVALWILIAHYLDLFWYVAPAFHPGRLSIHWLDIVLPVALGGGWLAAFAWTLGRRTWSHLETLEDVSTPTTTEYPETAHE